MTTDNNGFTSGDAGRRLIASSPRVPVRMALMPGPHRADDRVEIGKARRPAELGLRLSGRRIEDGRIARAARGKRPGHAATGDTLDRVDHLSHRVRLTRPQV